MAFLQVHEDEDIMGIFTPYEYTHIAPGKAFLQLTMFIGAVFGLCGIVYQFYPDKPAVPRTFYDNGLERSLGGSGALLVGCPSPFCACEGLSD